MGDFSNLVLLFSPIKFDELSSRAVGAVKDLQAASYAELCSYSEAQILRIPNCGKVTLEEIKIHLATLGFSLGMSEMLTYLAYTFADASGATFYEHIKSEDDNDCRICCQNCLIWKRQASTEVGSCGLHIRDQTFRLDLCSRYVDKRLMINPRNTH